MAPVPDTGTGWRYPLRMSADHLRQEALALPVDEHAALAKDLLLSLDGDSEPVLSKLGSRSSTVAHRLLPTARPHLSPGRKRRSASPTD